MLQDADRSAQVFFDPSPIGASYDEITSRAAQLTDPIAVGGSRLVVHIQTTQETIDDFLAVVRQLAEEKRAAGFVPSAQDSQPNGQPANIYVRSTVKN